MSIGENIRKARKKRNMTMKQLGEELGITEQAISQYERNIRTPNTKLVIKIAEILCTDPTKLDEELILNFFTGTGKVTGEDLKKLDEDLTPELKHDYEITKAIGLLLKEKSYEVDDFTEDEFEKIKNAMLSFIDIAVTTLKDK